MPTCFVVGQILMLFASRELRAGQSGPAVLTLPMKLILIYGAGVFIPVTAWYFGHRTGWSTVYLRPEDQIPNWAGPFILSTYFLGLFFGSLLAQSLIRANQMKMVYLTLTLGLVWLFGVWGLTLNEYLHIGTYAEYHSGQAVSIFVDGAFMKELNIMGALLAAPVIVLAIYFSRRSKKYHPI